MVLVLFVHLAVVLLPYDYHKGRYLDVKISARPSARQRVSARMRDNGNGVPRIVVGYGARYA
jgi:hypothetical protein